MSDPVTVSVLTHRLEAIVQEMGEAMLRTAYSQILNSSRDFSTALCDAGARLIAQAEHVPIHVGAIPWAVESVRDSFKGRIKPGDVYLLNDPYHGNNHLPDLTAFVPVFVGGEVAFWSVNRAHQSDIGGSTHGAYNPAATEIWQEGLRITPLKLYDGGELRDDVLRMITTNVRHPHDFMGDLRAMIGSARVGERRLLALTADYGAATVLESVDEILDGAERQARACVATWKDGVYRGETILDDDGHEFTDIWIRATVTKKGDSLTVDQRLASASLRIRELVVPEHDVGGAHGLRVPDRPADAEEFGNVPPGAGHRQAGHDRVAIFARARDALDQSLRPGDRRGDNPGAGAGVPRARARGMGPALPHRDQGREPANPQAVHLAHVPRSPRRRRDGRRRRVGDGG